MTAAITAAVVGGGLGLIGANKAAKGADADRALQQQVMDRLAQVQFNPWNVYSPGGAGMTFGQAAPPATGNAAYGTPTAYSAGTGPMKDSIYQPGGPGVVSGQGGIMDAVAQAFAKNMGYGTPASSGGPMQASMQYGEFAPYAQIFGAMGPAAMQTGLGLMGAANQNLPGLGSNVGIAQSLAGLTGQQAMGAAAGGGPLAGIAQGLFGQMGQLDQIGAGMGMMGNQAFQAGQGFLGQANPFTGYANQFGAESAQGFDALRQSTLDTLRQQASPYESKALSDMENRLFAQGRLDATSGGPDGQLSNKAYQSFAKGLSEADLQRQLQATGLAQQQQMQSGQLSNMFGGLANQYANTGFGGMGLAPAFAGAANNYFGSATNRGTLGGNIAGLEDDLLNSAFKRFAGTSGLANDLNQSLYGYGQQNWQQGMQGIAGQSGILDTLLKLGTFGANLGQTQAQTDINAAGGQANIANNLGISSGDVWGNFLTNAGSNITADSLKGVGDAFKKYFGNN